jgi:hypothetical protein
MNTRCALAALGVVLAAASGCAPVGWRTLLPSPEDFARERPPEVRVARSQCSILEVHGPRLLGDTLFGLADSGPVAIEVSEIRAITGYRSLPLARGDSARGRPALVRVARTDRSTVELRDPRLAGDTLVGSVGSASVRIDVHDVCSIREPAPAGTGDAMWAIGLLWLGIGLVGIIAAGGIHVAGQ